MKRTPALSVLAGVLLVGIVAFEIVVGAQVPGPKAAARTPAGVPAPATAPAREASGCDGTHATTDLKKAGYIKYSLIEEGCQGKNGAETCDKVKRLEKDSCADDKTVTKVSCENNGPKTSAQTCPSGTHCQSGVCK